MKGSSANVGARQLSALATKLESIGRDRTIAGSTELLAAIERHLEQIAMLLRNQFPE